MIDLENEQIGPRNIITIEIQRDMLNISLHVQFNDGSIELESFLTLFKNAI